jgi:hypothetical protein
MVVVIFNIFYWKLGHTEQISYIVLVSNLTENQSALREPGKKSSRQRKG